ncbi:hypothetical protein [Rhodopila sp.]|uniref:hypothetical protein n=1 Tax=Rhodopila sp. TaxID=2480087 RepID=UPI003D120E3E
MTQPDTAARVNPDAPDRLMQPVDILLAFIHSFLVPLFLAGGAGDVSLARLVTTETVASYQARTHADLVKIGQIIAFGMAVLDTLRLSMGADLSLTMKLRLRGCANALNRSAQQNNAALERSRRGDAAQEAASAHRAAADQDDIQGADLQDMIAQAQTMLQDFQAQIALGSAAATKPAETPPTPTQPALIQPTLAQPALAEPILAEPISAQPIQAEPIPAEPAAMQPAPADPPAAEQPAPVQHGPIQASPVPVLARAAPPRAAHPQPPAAKVAKSAAVAAGTNIAAAAIIHPVTASTGTPGHPMMWSGAMGTVASEMLGNLVNVPSQQRKAELMRIDALLSTASHLAMNAGYPLPAAKAVPIGKHKLSSPK